MNPKLFEKKWGRALPVLAVLAFSLGLRWLYWSLNPVMTRDAAMYCHIAKIWSRTGDFDIAYSGDIGGTAPLFIYFLKIGVDLGVPVVTWGHCLAFVFSGAFVFAFYLLGKALFDGRRDAALICMFVAGTQPVIGRISVDILREGPYLMFVAFGMVCFVRAFKTRSAGLSYWCGVLLGVSALLRHEGFELLFLAALGLLQWYRPRKDWLIWRNYLPIPLLAAGALSAMLLTMLVCGIPLRFMTGRYFSKLEKIDMQAK